MSHEFTPAQQAEIKRLVVETLTERAKQVMGNRATTKGALTLKVSA